MRNTTFLMDIIHSELIANGHNEFKNNHHLTFFEKDFSFIQKVLRYDEDVEKIVNETFFTNCKLKSVESDRRFKKAFINRFLNREIAFQTVETFNGMVSYVFLLHEDFLNEFFDNLDDYLHAKNTNDELGKSTDVTDNRYLSSSLPQSEVNLNVEDTELSYGDTNTISKTKSEKDNTGKRESKQYTLDELFKIDNVLESVFDDFDKKCFLQIW